MESQPQNPEFRIYPENFHPCKLGIQYKDAVLCTSRMRELGYTEGSTG